MRQRHRGIGDHVSREGLEPSVRAHTAPVPARTKWTVPKGHNPIGVPGQRTMGDGREIFGRTIRLKAVFQWLASLLADAQFLNDDLVAFGIGLSEVVQQAATPANHHEKTAPGGMVLLMRLKMLRQFTNPCAQDRNLDFRRTGIRVVSTVLVNQGGFFLSG